MKRNLSVALFITAIVSGMFGKYILAVIFVILMLIVALNENHPIRNCLIGLLFILTALIGLITHIYLILLVDVALIAVITIKAIVKSAGNKKTAE